MKIKDKRKRIAFDIDGTITKQGWFPDIYETTPIQLGKLYDKAEPDLEMIRLVNKYFNKGYIVYLFTSRSDLHERVTKKWLDKYKVKYHYFICNKPYYDCIIDDKCIHPSQLKLLDNNGT
jgi:uncharacterized HAD superfamily protein